MSAQPFHFGTCHTFAHFMFVLLGKSCIVGGFGSMHMETLARHSLILLHIFLGRFMLLKFDFLTFTNLHLQ